MNHLRVRGFTLIELVTVMVLVGILSIFVAPQFLGVTEYQQRGYFDRLIQSVRYAQKLAVTTRCEARMVIAASQFTLQIPQAVGECGSAGITWVDAQLPGEGPGPYTAPSSVGSSTATITFDASGAADGNYTVQVTPSLQFSVHGATGYVERL